MPRKREGERKLKGSEVVIHFIVSLVDFVNNMKQCCPLSPLKALADITQPEVDS